jgi:hypothetical protein
MGRGIGCRHLLSRSRAYSRSWRYGGDARLGYPRLQPGVIHLIITFLNEAPSIDETADSARPRRFSQRFEGAHVPPFMAMYMGLKLNQVHIDLRYILGSLGYTGGLKKCEEKAGIDRGMIEDVDGCTAVILWEEYRDRGKS